MRFLFLNIDWPGLVSSKTYKIHFALPPLDLLLMQNMAVKAGHEAQMIDCFVDRRAMPSDLFSWADWIIVSTTPYYMWQCPNVDWNWVKACLSPLPGEKTVLTGLHGSVFPALTLEETRVHAIIRGEPEAAFADYLRVNQWRECAGVAYRDAEEIVENPLPEPLEMEDLIVQDYAVDMGSYGYFLLGNRTGVFESSRGCPWKCSFCSQEMYSWRYRTKPAVLFAEEVNRAVLQTGMKTAYFFDLEFTTSKKRTLEICGELIRLNVQKRLIWACQTRADSINEEVITALKESGCKLIHFGVETANTEALKTTNKKTTLEKIERGIRLAKRAGLETACFFLFGLPGEVPDDFEKTIDFARRLNPTYASFRFAIPIPGTPLYERYLQEKGLPWATWPAAYFDDWPHERRVRFMKRAFLKFYLWPKRIEFAEFRSRLRNIDQKLAYFSSISSGGG